MDRINKLRNFMKDNKLDVMLISSFANIYYYSNFSSEDGFLFVTNNKCYLLTDGRYTVQAKKECKGVEICIFGAGKRISEWLGEIIGSESIEKVGFEGSMSYDRYKMFSDILNKTMISINIDGLRNIKDASEISKIRKACAIADKCYKHILEFVKVGMKEIDIRNEMLSYMLGLGASKESFDIIVASGKRGAMPHGVASNKKIKDGDFVTLDFGCVNNLYCSDITRTFVMGKPSKVMLEVYNVVREAQQRGLDVIKPGIKASEVDKACRDYIEDMGYGAYFTHSTGHGLGIIVHDPMGIGPNSDFKLEEGMVFTVEPGIYIEGIGGIRIEDDVVVTSSGHEVLTKASKKLYRIK